MAFTHIYRFNNNANDAIGSANGTGYNITYVAGIENQRACFNGYNSYIQLATKPMPLGAKTISFWVQDIKSTLYEHTIYGDLGGTASTYGIRIYISKITGILYFFHGNGSGSYNYFIGSSTLWDGKEYFICFTWDGTTGANCVKLYMNGVLYSTATATTTEVNTPSYNGRFGCSANAYTGLMNGYLEDFKISNVAWSPAQVKNEYSHRIGLI